MQHLDSAIKFKISKYEPLFINEKETLPVFQEAVTESTPRSKVSTMISYH